MEPSFNLPFVVFTKVTLDPSNLEAHVRDHLNTHAPRALAVLEPLKVTLTNFPHPDGFQVSIEEALGREKGCGRSCKWKYEERNVHS